MMLIILLKKQNNEGDDLQLNRFLPLNDKFCAENGGDKVSSR
jgi:hypothetical protein